MTYRKLDIKVNKAKTVISNMAKLIQTKIA